MGGKKGGGPLTGPIWQVMALPLRSGSGRVRSATVAEERSECVMCGKECSDEEVHFCDHCSRSLSREDPMFFDTLILASVLAVTISFMAIMGRTGSGGISPFGTILLEGPVRALLLLTLLPFSLIVLLKRGQVLSFRNLKGVSLMVFPLMISCGLVSFMVLGGGSEGLMFSLAILFLSLLVGTLSMKGMLRSGLPLVVSSFLGAFAFELGLASTIGWLDIRTGMWLIEGPFIMLTGIALVLFFTYRTYRTMDLLSKEGVPVLIFSFSLFTIISVLLYVSVMEVPTRPLIWSIGNLFLFLCIAMVVLAGKRMVDHVLDRTEIGIMRFITKGESLIGRGELFYGLQQLDLAIRTNPLDGFGKPLGTNNPLFIIEGTDHTDHYTFSPSPTELAFNEKGMTYCFQGRFSDAIRQFLEATRRDPKYLEPYWNLSTLLFTTPGKYKEGVRYMDLLMASKNLYMRRWLRSGIQKDHAEWMQRCYESYTDTLRRRADLLDRLSAKGDIWAYYRIVG